MPDHPATDGTMLYVALAHAARGGGPSGERIDVAVGVPDRSGASYDFAREEGIRIFNERWPSKLGAYHFGTY